MVKDEIVANSGVVADAVRGLPTAIIQVLGTWSATLQFEGSVDGGNNWFTVLAVPVSGGAFVTTTTANGNWLVQTVGLSNIRVKATAYTSGRASVFLDLHPTQLCLNSPIDSSGNPLTANGLTPWSYAAANSGIANSNSPVTIKAAASAGIRNYITGLDIFHESLTNATEVRIRDGSGGTTLWQTKIQSGVAGRIVINFPTPLRGTAATLLEILTVTASGAGAVYVNVVGYTAP